MSKPDKPAELPDRMVLLLAELDRVQKDAEALSERVRAEIENAERTADAERAKVDKRDKRPKRRRDA